MTESTTASADLRGLHQLAYELSLRSLSQQESVLNELRERTGTLLAASSLVASFLGARAIGEGLGWATVVALIAFAVSFSRASMSFYRKPV